MLSKILHFSHLYKFLSFDRKKTFFLYSLNRNFCIFAPDKHKPDDNMNSYFYLDANNQQAGPAPADQLVALGVGANTLVWCQGMTSWMKAGQVAELGGLFMPQPTVAPPPLPQEPAPQPTAETIVPAQQPAQQTFEQPQQAIEQPQPKQPTWQQPAQQAFEQPQPQQQPTWQQPAQQTFEQPQPQQQPTWQQPTQQQPTQQTFEQPQQQPGYQQPAYQQQQPGYQQPGYQQPGYEAPMGSASPCPPNYLAWSIVVTIICCWPFGIPAIVNAAKVNRLYAEGNVDGAYSASHNAKKWIIVSAIVGVVFWILYAIYVFVVIQNLR